MHIAQCSSRTALVLTAALFSTLTTANLASDRANYQQALTAFDAENTVQADKLTASLRGYPLYPYLVAKQLRRDIASSSDAKVADFLERYPNAPFSIDLQATRLHHLNKTQQWSKFHSAWQQKPLSSAKYRCQAAYADLKLGKRKAAFTQVAQLWNVGSSQHGACDPLFKVWMQAGNPSAELAKERFWKAADARNLGLARYLEKLLKRKSDKQDAALFFKASANPESIFEENLLKKGNVHHGSIAAYAVRKIARKDIYKAADLWLDMRPKLTIEPRKAYNLNRYFAMRFAKGYRKNAAQVLDKLDPGFADDKISEWKIRLALAEQNWDRSLALIEQLPASLKNSSRWLYWKEALKQRVNPRYTPNFAGVRQDRSFYGFLTSEITGAPYQLHYEAAGITEQEKASFAQRADIARMRELLANEQVYEARREWNAMAAKANKRDIQTASHVVYGWGWYDQAIRGASKIKAWNDLDIRFPVAHKPLFNKWSQDRNIDITWPISIARQESAYDRYAKSHAGAQGLMQLMPATAKATAKKHKVPYKKRAELFEPDTNIALGTAYLAEMLELFDGNRVYATAAYNAGPHRVKQWLAARGELPLDAWIETIPFDETRNYVQNVLSFAVIYDVRNQRKPSLLSTAEQALLALNSSARVATRYD